MLTEREIEDVFNQLEAHRFKFPGQSDALPTESSQSLEQGNERLIIWASNSTEKRKGDQNA